MRIGYLVAGFPVFSETFVVNDIRGLEALGHDVTLFALHRGDVEAAQNPNYQIRGRTVFVKGLRVPVWRKVQKLAARMRLRRLAQSDLDSPQPPPYITTIRGVGYRFER